MSLVGSTPASSAIFSARETRAADTADSGFAFVDYRAPIFFSSAMNSS